ncbi:30S ribosomal protein S8 [bacterium (Candidatus Blackallbacteria) CG17_big_fil_post_rev_8_21_14_2_50_48_46]|uniref:Small ribosomal subunit protein uS8 n=1 Tax=bacterium (Candidatus Blackallbacteria) CG17_big_fil_post_rev_8_21_14_2_50_48_46 TaxID=2014261 RepID=A0A2M7G127_9BACT|nr:MAG: 30S ribosomal protein S8 [bacterium (Candidatus Blackallbacteria) CG18_big_fil_WC_8_21_14_2_50_49_26]PIW15405.1 MAG: 30S ribosomal protein S8 [bacterium (Candidatus Blackallbacteria) CG17_big_fil_post_rev_8_21_14_2_50_48_46]PIW49734.1 MAG: 30S ribosomal protein S8 [bacterium (Candidatus Blackallbacteria) CG13_big_fil_rev_8_21_14_2_50_49_14]
MVTDPISDMLTRVRNALMLRKESVEVPHSKIKREVSRVLKENGYITDFYEVSDDKFKKIKLVLKYHEGRSVIQGLKRVSKPGRRVYVGTQEVPRVMGGMGVAVVSTSRGILTGHQARRLKVGGELLCYVW